MNELFIHPRFNELLRASAARHDHLCPRQVLGVRMGLYAGELLDIPVPQAAKRLLTLIESAGCFTDGVAVSTNCWVGRRTMWVHDIGKIAATFIDSVSGRALRISPSIKARELSQACVPPETERWQAYLLGYQRLSTQDLFRVQEVRLKTPVGKLVSQERMMVVCESCGEEVFNERELVRETRVLCRTCAGQAYYEEL